jgi:hypothetical protein
MNQTEKLRVLLPHWIEHNVGHGEECRKWSAIAHQEGQEKIAGHIDDAVKAMSKVNELLEMALREAGGPVHSGSREHHHDDHHDHHHDH